MLDPIGAFVTLEHNCCDECKGEIEDACYISFGKYDASTHKSAPDGVPDHMVYYYCDYKDFQEMLTNPTSALHKESGWKLLLVEEFAYQYDHTDGKFLTDKPAREIKYEDTMSNYMAQDSLYNEYERIFTARVLRDTAIEIMVHMRSKSAESPDYLRGLKDAIDMLTKKVNT